ncbi:uncharacterized protein [Amphiura filiformis]|uniref:uncharacterized protein n=1 Tax=Amphiura filiformis TaxID=82378 RepID=UPI003B2263D1
METILESDSSVASSRAGVVVEREASETSSGNGSVSTNKGVRRRTAMGEYIVPKGEMPLTQLALPCPGPANYDPRWGLTEYSAAQYSIVGRTKQMKPPHAPGSADYNTSGDLVWNKRTKTLKEKGNTHPYGTPPAYQDTPSLGPARYKVVYTDTGKHAPKVSCGSRHLDGVNGHPNALVQPVDTHGVQTPGPNVYDPSTEDRGHVKSFGSSRKTVSDTLGPGPAGYTIDESQNGPDYSLSKRLPAAWQRVLDNPAPNSYDLGTTIGKGVSKSLGARQQSLEKNWVPSPNTYILRDPVKYNGKPKALVSYRPFEHTLKTWPSPSHYLPSGKNLHSAPDYSCRKPCKPCFPDILKYPAQALDSTPAPGHYHKSEKKFTDNDAPAYSMGKRPKRALDDVPGANHYHIRVSHRPDGKKAPTFSMGSRSFPPNKNEFYKNENPAPTAYNRSLDTNSGIKYSMTKRRDMNRKNTNPASNAYSIQKGQTAKGVSTGPKATLKGRGTKFVYAGYALQSSVRLFDA